jgi:hypothetical protein
MGGICRKYGEKNAKRNFVAFCNSGPCEITLPACDKVTAMYYIK